ncbi:MAG: hypothetical protein HOQ27_10660 [Dermatophilaceae bacterium]|nr:hypothetical protein [Dermatophilaceae bacterium]
MSEPFDFEAFISGAKLAEDTFDLYLVNHGPAIARLREQIEQAKGGSGDDREATVGADVSDLERQVARLTAEMQQSKREVTLRSVTPDELEKIAGDGTDVYDQLAIQSVKPELDRDQWKRLGNAVGSSQFAEFVSKANALATLRVVVPDFSPTISTSQDQRESSLS